MAKKMNEGVTHGVSKTPMIMQLEALECGAACLTMILAYYGKWIPLEQVRSDCGVSRDGSNAKNILMAARYYGLNAKGYRFEPEALKESGVFPCIIHWNFNHFVVLNGFKGGKAYINDPARGTCSVSMEAFDESFTGVCLMFSPSEKFVPSGKPKSMLSFASKRLKGTGTAIAFTMLTGLISALIGFISPGFSRFFVDRLLTGTNREMLMPFLLILGGFDLIQIIMSAINSVYSLRIKGKMASVGNASYMWQVLHLPMDFFSQRMAGDIQSRQLANAGIANSLISTFGPLAINVLMMVFYFAVMLRYSPLLTAVGLLSLTVNALVSNYISKKRINITRVSTKEAAKLSSATVAGIEMIETIKSGGAENRYFAKWAGYQAAVNSQDVKYLKLDKYLGLIPQFVSSVASDSVLIIGVFLVFRGEFTVGMIMAFQGFLSSFMSPALSMVSAGQQLQEMRTQMERVDDVMKYSVDDIFSEDDSETEFKKLSGKVEVKNITFGYSRLAEPVIKDFSLSVEPGKSVAVVGSSGCGKSTVSKLISGLYRPWSGEILFDGKPLEEIDKNVFFGSFAVIDQDIILFEDTVANNIKMWDDSIEDFEMIMAARDAQIHFDITERPGGYQYRLNEGGKDFSGGQRQRLEIARVLAQDPTVIILDEATSALDSKTEYEVVNAIRQRGIACVVIAHRLSTVRSCDEIIVMDSGEIVASGTHDELMNNCEIYRELVINE